MLMGIKKIGEWMLVFWFILFVAIMVAETIYLQYTGTIYMLDYEESTDWIESWGVFAYTLDVIFFYICYKMVAKYRLRSAESSNSRSDS